MDNKGKDLLTFFVAIALPLVAGGLGSVPTAGAIPTWYRDLKKAPWNPPSWVFGPVWTLLYVLMGTAVGLVWRAGWAKREVRTATGLFAGQLVLNVLWSLIFFGLRAPGLALAEILVLWTQVAATLAQFRRVRPLAGWLMVPYLAWVTYAIIPIFALANAGVSLSGGGVGALLLNPVSLGVIAGLVIGKQVGISLAVLAAVKTGLAKLPEGVNWLNIYATSWLAGIGFTMSLFISELAFEAGGEALEAAKTGILAASLLAGAVGYLLLRRSLA